MYELGQSYDFVITVADSATLAGADGNTKAGFLMTDNGAGMFSWDDSQDIREADGDPNAISHSATGEGVWAISWMAPSDDSGTILFSIAGNSVNGDGAPNEYDYWNILTFSINAPGSVTEGDSEATLQTRTIAVGDYQTLFVIEESESEKEKERQRDLSDAVFESGNLFYWTTLSIIIIGAVVQGEFYERKFGGGPPHLDMSLAVPQGVRRGILSVITILMFAWSLDSAQAWGIILVTGMLMLWAIFGVYRTVVQARAPKQYTDLV